MGVAFPSGAWVDLRSGNPDEDDPANAGRWGNGRIVRAQVITALLLGARDIERGYFPAVRLRGARVTGQLDLMGAVVSHALVLEGCRFDEPPRFVEATTKTVRIVDSHLPAFNGARMRTEGILNFHRSVIDGILRLDRAQVDGEISLRGAQVGDGTGEAIAATGLTVSSTVLVSCFSSPSARSGTCRAPGPAGPSSSAASCSPVGSALIFFVTSSSVAVITAPLPPSRQSQRDRAGNTARRSTGLIRPALSARHHCPAAASNGQERPPCAPKRSRRWMLRPQAL